MASQTEESDQLIQPVRHREAQTTLLSPVSESHGRRFSMNHLSYLPCNICVESKAAVLLLVWSVVIGIVYLSLLSSFGVLGYVLENQVKGLHLEPGQPGLRFVVPVYTVLAAYSFLATILLLYPLSGYIADIYCGRYKTVTRSFILLWVAIAFLSVAAALVKFMPVSDLVHIPLKHLIPLAICLLLSVLLMIISLAGYQANIIQLGLDQLLEAPSEKLGLFVHWLMWAFTLGSFLTLLSIVLLPCYVEKEQVKLKLKNVIVGAPCVFLAFLTVLLVFTCYNHSWFYSEPGQNNPYKIVFKVLNFARKNKYPLRRSAFTFCDDFKPSRIDFAKERYGGPFTTPQVEDVKTFLRIVLVLLALGPVFVLEVPGSYYLFPLFALHVADEVQFIKRHVCVSPSKWVLLQSQSGGYIISIVFLPLYIWIVFSLFRKRIPTILKRLQGAVVISLVGVLSMLITDLVGHIKYHLKHHIPLDNSTEGTCLFTSHTLYGYEDSRPNILELHWGATVVPSILLNFGSLLVQASSFEFISAQSPHSMKGLLVGVFFAIKGLFQFISAAAVVPFAIPNIWNHINPVTNCAFGYYLFTIVVASIGLMVFSIVVKRYRYRQRDERPYDSRFAEDYYERYIGSTQEQLDTLSDVPLHYGATGVTA